MEKLKVKAVFFDLWHTLAFSDLKKDFFMDIQERLGLNEITHAQFMCECEQAIMLEKFESLDQLYTKLLNHFSHPVGEILLGDLDFLWNKSLKTIKLYPETKKVLKKTRKNFKTALVSNCENFAVNHLNSNGLKFNDFFDETILSCDVALLKPNPKIFRLPLKKLKIKPAEAVMVGDSLRTDMTGAKRAGMKSILIDRKNRHKGKKLSVDAVIHSLDELDEIIEFKN